MALSKSTRIIILLVIDSAFFLLELISGYTVHSLALVADSFHMLNDVLSLCVGLWAVQMANRKSTSKMYTYGYQRAETLGALVNGVFLVALCVTIFLDAIQRFVEPQVVSNPKLVLIVGCLGLASNIFGLALFHDHGHGGHGHSHGPGGHSHDALGAAEEGHADHEHDHAHNAAANGKHSHSHSDGARPGLQAVGTKDARITISDTTHPRAETATSDSSTAVDDSSLSRSRSHHRHSRSLSKGVSVYDDFAGPVQFRNSIIAAGNKNPQDSGEDTDADGSAVDDDEEETANASDNTKPLLSGPQQNGYGTATRKSIDHGEHHHRKPKPAGASGGHSHGDLNMRGIFLHVMGDALGNIGVIATALIIWLTDFSWRFYFDPAISLVITVIILCSAIPLCKAASRILLQAVPPGLEVDELRADIEQLPGIESAHHVHVWQLSDTKLVASLHVKVGFNFEGDGSKRYMRLAAAIRECLHEYGIHSSTIQPEFCHGLDDGHDHDADPTATVTAASSSAGDGAAGSAGAAIDESQRCLLDCDDQCASGQTCCPPQGKTAPVDSHDGHDHGHSH